MQIICDLESLSEDNQGNCQKNLQDFMIHRLILNKIILIYGFRSNLNINPSIFYSNKLSIFE